MLEYLTEITCPICVICDVTKLVHIEFKSQQCLIINLD